MTLWEFFNNHPIVGLLFSVMTIYIGGVVVETIVSTIGKVLIAKYTGAVEATDVEEPTQPEGDE